MKYFKIFIILFLANLSFDIYFNNVDAYYTYRFITKPLITILLMAFFYINSNRMQVLDRYLIMIALVFLLIGDIFLFEKTSLYNFLYGFLAFLVANLAYSYFFYKKATYDIDRLLPYLTVALLLSFVMIFLIYDGLGDFLIPATAYFIVVLNLNKLAYLRYKNVNNYSFYLVFFGTTLFALSQGFVGLHVFYEPLPYKNIIIMSTYGTSQLLVILGIILSQKRTLRQFLLS